MNILIIDNDNTSINILSYVFAKIDNIAIFYAQNSKDAIGISKIQNINLIFINIDMPQCDYLEIIPEIREYLGENAVIVGCSLKRDAEIIKKLFRLGVEDFILKPYNLDILRQKINNYQAIMSHRKNQSYISKPLNNFAISCGCFHSVFKIKCKNDLAEFWEYFTSNANDCKSCNIMINDLTNIIFNLCLEFLKFTKVFHIYIEHNKTEYFITVANLQDIKKWATKSLTLYHSSHYEYLDYKIDSEQISFRVSKTADNIAKAATNINIPEEAQIQLMTDKIEVELCVYNFLTKEDITKLKNYLICMEATLNILKFSKLTSAEALMLANSLSKVASLLNTYQETYEISIHINNLSSVIKKEKETFVKKSKKLSNVLLAFFADLFEWQIAICECGAPSIDFMNTSIIANVKTLINIILPAVIPNQSHNIDPESSSG
ncbi:MAG: hypothetical protein RL154_508 [Pseudomonadota bacterium]|jgi:CheY-like chemotaxis protein